MLEYMKGGQVATCFKHFLVFTCLWEGGRGLRCTHTVRSLTRVLVVVSVARKPHPCPSYSRRRDRFNLVLLRSCYKGGRTELGPSMSS